MSYGETKKYAPGYLEGSKSTFAESFYANAQESLKSGTSDLIDGLRVKYYEKTSDNFVSRADALSQAQERGVELQNLPESIPQEGLDIMLKRQEGKVQRAKIIESADSTTANILGSLAGALIDPAQMALNAIPFVGEAKIAATMSRVFGASRTGKIASATATGAYRGLGGAVVTEPLFYDTANYLGDKYTLADSARNVALGAVLGGVIHGGIGTYKELKAKTPREELPGVAKDLSFEVLDFEDKKVLAQSYMAQEMGDKKPNLDIVTKSLAHQESLKVIKLSDRLIEAKAKNNPELITELTKELNKQIDIVQIHRMANDLPELSPIYDLEKTSVVKGMPGDEVAQRVAILTRNEIPVTLTKSDGSQLPFKSINENTIITNSGDEIPVQKFIDEGGVIAPEKDHEVRTQEANTSFIQDKYIEDARTNSFDLKKEFEKIPERDHYEGSKYIDDNLSKYSNSKIIELEQSPMAKLDEVNAKTAYDDEMLMLKKEMDFVDPEYFDDFKKSSDDIVAKSNEYADFVAAIGDCIRSNI